MKGWARPTSFEPLHHTALKEPQPRTCSSHRRVNSLLPEAGSGFRRPGSPQKLSRTQGPMEGGRSLRGDIVAVTIVGAWKGLVTEAPGGLLGSREPRLREAGASFFTPVGRAFWSLGPARTVWSALEMRPVSEESGVCGVWLGGGDSRPPERPVVSQPILQGTQSPGTTLPFLKLSPS